MQRATLAEGLSCRGPLLQRATLAEGHSCRGPLLLRSDGPPQEWVVDARMKFLHTRTESIHVVNTVRPRRITVRPRRITVRPRREHSPFTSHHSPSTREQGRPTREQGRSSSRESGVRVWPQRAIGPPQEWALSYLLFTAPVPFLSRRSFSRRLALTASVPHRSQFLVGSMRPMRRLRRFATVLGFHCFRLSRPPARPVPRKGAGLQAPVASAWAVSGRGLQAAASAQAVISGRVQQARRAAARRLPQFKRKVGGVFMVFTLRLFLENIVMRTAWVLT